MQDGTITEENPVCGTAIIIIKKGKTHVFYIRCFGNVLLTYAWTLMIGAYGYFVV